MNKKTVLAKSVHFLHAVNNSLKDKDGSSLVLDKGELITGKTPFVLNHKVNNPFSLENVGTINITIIQKEMERAFDCVVSNITWKNNSMIFIGRLIGHREEVHIVVSGI